MGRLRPSAFAVDTLIALALAGFGQAEAWAGWAGGSSRALLALSMLPAPLVLVARRRAPLTVVMVVFAAFPVQALLGVGISDPFAPVLAGLVAIGSAAYFAARPVLALAVGIVLVWSSQVIMMGLVPPADLLWQAVLIGLGWSVGRGFAVGMLRAQLAEQRAATAMAEDRLRIARDLHDSVAHSVSVMLLHAGGVRRLLHPGQHDERQGLQVVERTGRQALTEMRHMLDLLREAPRLDHAGELLDAAERAGLSARLRVEGAPRPLPPDVDQSAYRILQEALTNVLRHARATRVEATIGFSPDGVRIEVTDDGAMTGSAVTDDGVMTGSAVTGDGAMTGSALTGGTSQGSGNGLSGMRERTAIHGGSLEAGPLPGGGFRVLAVIPAQEAGP
jgi:signal transduction histidine kinase